MTRHAAFASALCLLACACRSSGEVPNGAKATASSAPAIAATTTQTTTTFEHAELLAGGAERAEGVPLIVAMHGLGDSPEHFVGLFQGFPCPAHIVLPHSDVRYGSGYTWFAFNRADPDFAGPEIAKRADELAAFAHELARSTKAAGRPLVTGFSQGGALSFALEARHGAELGGVFPISGWLPDSVPESGSAQAAAPLVAFHGAADTLIAVDRARSAVARLTRGGFKAELIELPGVPHAISDVEREQYFEKLAAACAAEAKRR